MKIFWVSWLNTDINTDINTKDINEGAEVIPQAYKFNM